MTARPIADEARRFLTFAALGVIGTAAHYAVLIALVREAGADPVVGSAAGFVTGGLVNYLLNRRITFRSQKRHGEAAIKFFLVAGSGLVLNSLLMALLTKGFALPYLPAQVAVTATLLLWHYAGNALWTFRERHQA